MSIIDQKKQTHIIIVTPEIGNLAASDIGELANLLSAKGGGLGDVSAAMFTGLKKRGVKVSLFAPNFQRIYRENAGLSAEEWREKRHSIDPQGIWLVDSNIFTELPKIYGNKGQNGENLDLLLSARFQENARHGIKHIEATNHGRVIVDIQEHFGSGALAAYLKSRRIPFVQTMHNTHTSHIPLHHYYDMNINSFFNELYISRPETGHKNSVDTLATGIKNADFVKYVGKSFMERIANGELDYDSSIPRSVIDETKIKYALNQVGFINNSISPIMYPENNNIPKKFDCKTEDIIAAKNINKLYLQKKFGLKQDENALLYVSTSRLDPHQKGVQTFAEAIRRTLREHEDVQFFIIGDPVKDSYAEYIKQDLINLSLSSNGRVAYSAHNDADSILAYAAATDSFGASFKEPFGQNDVISFINGGTATNNNVDGYKDKITPLNIQKIKKSANIILNVKDCSDLKANYELINMLKEKKLFGNGFLFNGSNEKELYQGLKNSIETNKYLLQNKELANAHARLRMIDAKKTYRLDNMVDKLIDLYENIERKMIDTKEWI